MTDKLEHNKPDGHGVYDLMFDQCRRRSHRKCHRRCVHPATSGTTGSRLSSEYFERMAKRISGAGIRPV